MKFEVLNSTVREIDLSDRISDRAKKQRRVFFMISLVLIVLLFDSASVFRTILNILPGKDIEEIGAELKQEGIGISAVFVVYCYYFMSFLWFFRQTWVKKDVTAQGDFSIRATGLEQWLSTDILISETLNSYIYAKTTLSKRFIDLLEPIKPEVFITQLTSVSPAHSQPFSPDGGEYVKVVDVTRLCRDGETHHRQRKETATLSGDEAKYEDNMKTFQRGFYWELAKELLYCPAIWVEFLIPVIMFAIVVIFGLLPILFGGAGK